MRYLVIAICASLTSISQNLPNGFTFVMEEEQITKEAIVYASPYDKKVDENVLWALKKYWTFKTPITTADKTATHYDKNKNISVISIDDYESKGDQGSFFNTKFTVTNKLEKPGNKNVVSYIFTLPFDNLIKKDEKDIVVGSDKNLSLIADKSLTYTMLYCSLIKNYTFKVDGGAYKRAGAYLKVVNELHDKYKDNIVLIPEEILANGVTKEAFSGLKYKYEFMSTANIAKRIKEGNVKNYSHLFLVKEDKWNDYSYIVNLENGDLVNWSNLGSSTFGKTYNYMNDKRVKELLAKLY